jgi:hypothetical protein
MDFFERFLHINPDGGSGATEALYAFAVLAAIVCIVFARRFVSFVRSQRR